MGNSILGSHGEYRQLVGEFAADGGILDANHDLPQELTLLERLCSEGVPQRMIQDTSWQQRM